MPREINEAGYDLVKEFEQGPGGGPALLPYYCPAGKLTNGWGNTFNVTPGVRITLEQAKADLDRNLDWAEACVEKYAKNASGNEFAGMASMCFNIGPDPKAGFPSSTVLRLHNAGDKIGAAKAFENWNKAVVGGVLQPLAGLTRRRKREALLYLTPDVEPFQPQLMPQVVAPEKSVASSKTIITTIAGGALTTGGIADNAPAALDAIDKATATITQAHSTWAGVEVAIGPLLHSRALPFILGVLALAAIGYVGWRYGRKLWKGEAVSS